MKVVLIAGFSSPEIREHLNLTKESIVVKRLIRIFHLPSRVGEVSDHAPWIPNIIFSLANDPDIELHVIGPHLRLRKPIVEFDDNGVYYHFFKTEWTSFLRILNNYWIWKCLQMSGRYTKRLLKKIKPDIVLLSGAENPATSVSILYADKYPRYCLCQTIYNNPDRAKYSTPNRLIQEMEKDIFSELNFFGVYSKMHYDLLHGFRPDANIFKYGYPSKGKLLEPTETEKEYDFVNFALQMGLRKGFPDAIQALAIVKKQYPNVKLNLLGQSSDEQRAKLDNLIAELDLKENVFFTPFFEKRSDMFLHIQKSCFALLPCKLDHTSGTMIQSMQLGLPLVVYKTTGTPKFNREKECALIAEHGNVEDLAAKMLILMQDSERARQMAINAREYQEHLAEVKRSNGDRLIANIKAIVGNYKNGTPIPQEQLFNPERDD